MPGKHKAGSNQASEIGPRLPNEDPWTKEEWAEQRESLEAEIASQLDSLRTVQAELDSMRDDGATSAGDSMDVSSSNYERDQELTIAQNAQELLEQAQLALQLFDSGQYGLCETCHEPIGKRRLQFRPSATLCRDCKEREERR